MGRQAIRIKTKTGTKVKTKIKNLWSKPIRQW